MNNYYLAGFVDGEGYISLIPVTHKKYLSKYYIPVVKIASTNEEIINMLKRQYGGYVYKRTFPNSRNQKDAWAWEIKNKKSVLEFLIQIVDKLKIKKRNAELVIEYCKFPFGFSKKRYKNTYSPKLVIRARDILEELKVLNHRGINTSND